MTAEPMVATRTGLVLTGQFLGTDEAYTFTPNEPGAEPIEMKPAIKLLVDTHVEKVPFDPSKVTLAELVGTARRGDLVSVRVWASGPYNRATRRSEAAKFRVRVDREDEGDEAK